MTESAEQRAAAEAQRIVEEWHTAIHPEPYSWQTANPSLVARITDALLTREREALESHHCGCCILRLEHWADEPRACAKEEGNE